MSAHWHIGMEVECIRNDLDNGIDHRLVVGARYTVRKVVIETGWMWDDSTREGIAICLNEIWGSVPTDDGCFTDAYWPEYFRPVQTRKTDISALKAILLNPHIPVREDA
jgi:hypothetical protein